MAVMPLLKVRNRGGAHLDRKPVAHCGTCRTSGQLWALGSWKSTWIGVLRMRGEGEGGVCGDSLSRWT